MGPLIRGVAQVDLDSGVDVAANIISLVFLWSLAEKNEENFKNFNSHLVRQSQTIGFQL